MKYDTISKTVKEKERELEELKVRQLLNFLFMQCLEKTDVSW